jgi:hypothetical protein
MKKLLFILALSIQATANDQVIVQALQGLANQWNQPSYYNNYEYSPPTDSFGPYKQYMQRQQELQAPSPSQAPKPICIADWIYSEEEGRYIPAGCK